MKGKNLPSPQTPYPRNRTTNLRIMSCVRPLELHYVIAILILFIASTTLGQNSYEGIVVDKIEIVGNYAVSTTKILPKIRSRAREKFNSAGAAEDAKRIAQVEGVEYAYYNTQVIDNKLKLTFVVVEKNIVRTVQFIGNKNVKEKSLLKKLEFKTGDFLNKYIAQSGLEVLTEYYQKQGYAFVKVELETEQLQAGRVIYHIDEGPKVKIKAVEFSGNSAIPTDKLRKAIKTKKQKMLFWQQYYIEKELKQDVSRLASLYQKKGYLDAQIKMIPEFNEEKNAVIINFVISEGPIYNVDEIIFIGNKFFDEQTLKSELQLITGQVYNQQWADFDTKKILSRYREKGFLDAQVIHRRKFIGPGRVRSEFEIIEGQRFKIGKINITGNKQTQDKVIRRVLDEYDFKPGEWYNSDIARGTGQGELEIALKKTVLTKSAVISATGTEPDQRDAQVSIVEGQTGMILIGAGIDSSAGFIGQLVFEQRNFDILDWPSSWNEFITGRAFKGGGQTLRIALEPGTEQTQYSINFTEPYLDDKPISMDVIASSYNRGRESYDETRTRGYLAFEERFRNGWHRGIGFRVENVKIDNIDLDAPYEILSVSGDNLLYSAKVHISKNTTNNRFNPTEGYIFNTSYDQVTGDDDFGVVSGVYRLYKTLTEDYDERKTVLAAKVQAAGIVVGDAPPFEKFYAGGMGSIRGFDYRGISTRGLASDGSGRREDPIGSDWIFLANAEISIPLEAKNLSMLFFVDSGTIDTGCYRAAIGTGVQILVPQWFGPVPMRFEFATPMKKDDDDDTQVFSFSIGRLF
jgi:outer membrane protein insertion porin family